MFRSNFACTCPDFTSQAVLNTIADQIRAYDEGTGMGGKPPQDRLHQIQCVIEVIVAECSTFGEVYPANHSAFLELLHLMQVIDELREESNNPF